MDPEDVAREANELQDRVAERHIPKLAKAITDAMLAVARDLPTSQRPDPPLDHFRRVSEAMQRLYRDVTRSVASSMVDQFKDGFEWLESKADEEDFYERLYEQYLQSYGGSSISKITETTRRQLVAIIERGLKEGASVAEIAQNIEESAPALGEVRAEIISRTETHSAAMFSSLQSAKRSSIPLQKEWISVEDGRTRDFGESDGVVDEFSHRAMNGVRKPIDDPYEVPGRFGVKEKLMFPGDPAGSPGNVIRCRCAQTYVRAEQQADETPPAAPRRRQPRPRFRYEDMDDPPAKLDALNSWVIENGIADRADLKGVTAREIAPLMRYFLEAKERFDLDPLIGVGPASRFGMRKTRGANAAIFLVTERSTGRKGIWHMPTTFGNRKNYEELVSRGKYWQKKYTSAQDRRVYSSTTSDEVRTRYETMIEDEEAVYNWTLNALDEPDLHRRKIIYHEYGHVVHLVNTRNPKMGEEIDEFLRRARPRQEGWSALLSEYAATNDRELVAESFSLYMSGPEAQHYRIHPELLAIFQRWDRANTVKSFRIMPLFIEHKQVTIEQEDGVALIQRVLAAPREEQEALARKLLKEYEGGDKLLVETWLYEAIALEVVDTI